MTDPSTDYDTTPLGLATLDDMLDELARRFDHVLVVAAKPNPQVTGDELVYTGWRGSHVAALGLTQHAAGYVNAWNHADEHGREQ